ncbi:MAG: cell division protein ZapE [Robiginitomaculum sp.]|nr:cell division protein ZapE [Robiginitomaculum sp.]MDQ7077111.1 cell division protein ZapE [Robiginitomaculum sp.]
MDTPITRWRALVETRALEPDPAQERAAQMLSVLQGRLKGWKPGKRRMLFGRPEPEPEGVYLYGGVGRGKSMLMDMFFETVPFTQKRRVHFHEFMLETHAALARWRKMDNRQRRQHQDFVRGVGDDPIAPVANAIAREAWLLCFDEMQVNDIADAMLLGRLFDQLFERGVIIVTTSNRPPDDLYKDGLNRQRFLPFIESIKSRLAVHALESARDYRLGKLREDTVYFSPLNDMTRMQINAISEKLTTGLAAHPRRISLAGRHWDIAQTAGGVARLDFDEVCEEARGSADYLELARQFHTLVLENVPILDESRLGAAKRFVALIDALYEARVKLIISAAALPEQLYQARTGDFEFERTVSRLNEMQSSAYLAAGHGNSDLAI